MKKVLSILLTLAMLVSFAGFAMAEEKVAITWWVFPVFGQEEGAAAGTYEQKVIEAFQAANPDITVNIETIDFSTGPDKLVAAIEGGTAPDVLFDAPGRIVEYGKNGKMLDLSDLFTEEFKKDVNNEALVEACGADGKYYMYPISSSPFYMALNLERFKETGAIEYVNLEGDRTWTTENFVKALEKLSEAGFNTGSVYCMNQGGDQGTRALVSNLYSARIANEEKNQYTINSENGVKALELLKKLVDEGKLQADLDINAAGELQYFQQGVLSMSFCWGTSNAKNYKSDEFTAVSVPFPSEDGTPELEYLVNGFGIFDNGDAKRAEAAKKFVQFICDDKEWGPKNVVQTGAFPVRTSFGNLYEGDKEYELLSSFTKYYGPYYNTMDGFNNMRAEWWGMLQRVFKGDQTPKEAADEYANNSNAAFAK